MITKKYAPKLPLSLDTNGNFNKIQDILENTKQILRMIVLTNPGEKIMDSEFGLGIKRYLFEDSKGIIKYNFKNKKIETIEISNFQNTIERELKKQAVKYYSDLIIVGVMVDVQEQLLKLRIDYSYRGIVDDNVEIALTI